MTVDQTMMELRQLLARADAESYGEAVTMGEHLRLTAAAARDGGAADALIVACLLHDVGHFLEEPDDEYGYHDHANGGAAFLAERFPRSVSEPVRLHVAAKRYLCARDPNYHSQLSPASQFTLRMQGGPMSAGEAARFEAEPWAEDAIRLRRSEDSAGKRSGAQAPDWQEFLPLVEAVAGHCGG